MAYNVFISYSSKNLHIVEWARATLAQPGITEVFAAEYSVLPSQVLNDEIVRAIRACDVFVLLWTHDARASDYVPQEIGIAVGCNKTILPVVMEDNVPVPGFITNLKYLPAHKDWDASFQWLTQFVHDNAEKLKNAKALGALAAIILGAIWLFGDHD
ncbi:MAG TPA: toll/interleukin-1 receptor domain-containing protein [Candidatus Acidoferrum sp.]|nr:toll/interleukin-1 receptor domain-containing protein [Candidatus Acidoferrum sp.]